MNPRLPDGTPTANVPCVNCGDVGADHVRGTGACMGDLRSIPIAVEIPRDRRKLEPQPVVQCVRRCKAYQAPGGVLLLN